MGWFFFFVVMVVCAIMLLLSGIKLFINVLGFISFMSLVLGTGLFIAHKVIKRKNGSDSTVTMIPVTIFGLLGIAILVGYIISCRKSGSDIDLVRFFFLGLRRSIW